MNRRRHPRSVGRMPIAEGIPPSSSADDSLTWTHDHQLPFLALVVRARKNFGRTTLGPPRIRPLRYFSDVKSRRSRGEIRVCPSRTRRAPEIQAAAHSGADLRPVQAEWARHRIGDGAKSTGDRRSDEALSIDLLKREHRESARLCEAQAHTGAAILSSADPDVVITLVRPAPPLRSPCRVQSV